MENIFIILSKHQQSQENYFTEAFVYFLKFLRDYDPEKNKQNMQLLCDILNEICDTNRFVKDSPINIKTQFTDFLQNGLGIPDINIETEGLKILIENKMGAPVTERQIRNYKKIIEELSQNKEIIEAKVILITQYDIDLPQNVEDVPKKYWHQVYYWVKEIIDKYKSNFDKHTSTVTSQFLEFMEDRNMSCGRVSWEYVNGLASLVHMSKQLTQILINNNVSKKVIFTSSYMGETFDSGNGWIGVYYDDPTHLYIECKHERRLKSNSVIELNGKPSRAPGWDIDFKLNLEEGKFFCMKEPDQIDIMNQFLKNYLEKLK